MIARLYRAIVAWRLGRLYHRNARVVPMVWMGRGNTNLTLKSSSGLLRRRRLSSGDFPRSVTCQHLQAPVNPSTILAGCTNFLTVYLNSVNLWSFAFLSYLLSIFRVYCTLISCVKAMVSMVSRNFVNFLFKYRRNTAQACPERYQVFQV